MAKFKKGDRVVATEPDYQTKGVGVVRGYEYSWDEEIEKDDPGYYIVDFPNQYKVKMSKGSLRLANAARSTNSIVAKAMNAVARNADGLNGLIADLDSGKYDSVNWMPKVIGPGTLYPDGMKFPTGLGYDDEEKVRAAWKSGKYASVVLYKGGSKRGEIPVNADTSTISEKAVNAKFKVGDYCTIRSGIRCKESGKTGQIVDLGEINGRKTFVMKMEDGHTISGFVDSFIDDSSARVRNAAGYVDASSVVLYPGDAVVFKAQYISHEDDDEWLERNGDTVREVRGNEVKIGPSANDWAKKSDLMVWHNAARSRNSVVQKALNAEDAQGHEHGADGKFASKDGGSSDGGYEDPKTKRMRERLAKMREKNEALRKDIEARRAGLAQKKADTEKMRAEVMKANVEKWKASQKSKNAVVQNALNAATARNAVAMNWNFKNSYKFFCVDPSLKAPCILSGWDYREDAKDDAAELKEAGIPHKIVSRRFLEQQGIDPNAESSWKKNRQ